MGGWLSQTRSILRSPDSDNIGDDDDDNGGGGECGNGNIDDNDGDCDEYQWPRHRLEFHIGCPRLTALVLCTTCHFYVTKI